MKLIVDDIRTAIMIPHIPPWEQNDWTIARSVNEAKKLIETNDIEEISLDHDMGNAPGGDCIELCTWLTSTGLWGKIGRVHFHSANPVGVVRMRQEYEFYLSAKKRGLI